MLTRRGLRRRRHARMYGFSARAIRRTLAVHRTYCWLDSALYAKTVDPGVESYYFGLWDTATAALTESDQALLGDLEAGVVDACIAAVDATMEYENAQIRYLGAPDEDAAAALSEARRVLEDAERSLSDIEARRDAEFDRLGLEPEHTREEVLVRGTRILREWLRSLAAEMRSALMVASDVSTVARLAESRPLVVIEHLAPPGNVQASPIVTHGPPDSVGGRRAPRRETWRPADLAA